MAEEDFVHRERQDSPDREEHVSQPLSSILSQTPALIPAELVQTIRQIVSGMVQTHTVDNSDHASTLEPDPPQLPTPPPLRKMKVIHDPNSSKVQWFDESNPTSQGDKPVSESALFHSALGLLESRDHLSDVNFLNLTNQQIRPNQAAKASLCPPALPLHAELTGWYGWSSQHLDDPNLKSGQPFFSHFVNGAQKLYVTRSGDNAVLYEPREPPLEYADISTCKPEEVARTANNLANTSPAFLKVFDTSNRVGLGCQSYVHYFQQAAAEENRRARLLIFDQTLPEEDRQHELSEALNAQYHFLNAAEAAAKETTGALVNVDANFVIRRRDILLSKLLPLYKKCSTQLRAAPMTSKNLLPTLPSVIKDSESPGAVTKELMKALTGKKTNESNTSSAAKKKDPPQQPRHTYGYRGGGGGGRGGGNSQRRDDFRESRQPPYGRRARDHQRDRSRTPRRSRSRTRQSAPSDQSNQNNRNQDRAGSSRGRGANKSSK